MAYLSQSSTRNTDLLDDVECTQQLAPTQISGAMDIDTDMGNENNNSSSNNNNNNNGIDSAIWGILRRTKGDYKDIELRHRNTNTQQGETRDYYTIGRSKDCDIEIKDNHVSQKHCMIYCDYSSHIMKVVLADTSSNGTFVNSASTKLSKNQTIELKNGDEIFLKNPRFFPDCAETKFLFINMRERLYQKREIHTSSAVKNMISRQSSAAGGGGGEGGGIGGIGGGIGGVGGGIGGGGIVVVPPVRPHIEDTYIIGEQIGSGCCGQVHVCVKKETFEYFAVKIIDTKKFSITGLTMEDLRQEAAMLKSLDHPNIIKVKDTFETNSVIYIVMELLRGGDLFDRILEKGKYSEKSAKIVIEKILLAVQYLHKNNIIHRDLKPENILLVGKDDDESVKLTDFGLAKKTSQEGLKTFCGTPQYFAPEVLKRKTTMAGTGRYNSSADIWSIGVILYILLSGTFPFEEDHVFEQIQTASYSLSGPEWVGISEEAKSLVKALMTLRPDQRISIEKALMHPWISGNRPAQSNLGIASNSSNSNNNISSSSSSSGSSNKNNNSNNNTEKKAPHTLLSAFNDESQNLSSSQPTTKNTITVTPDKPSQKPGQNSNNSNSSNTQSSQKKDTSKGANSKTSPITSYIKPVPEFGQTPQVSKANEVVTISPTNSGEVQYLGSSQVSASQAADSPGSKNRKGLWFYRAPANGLKKSDVVMESILKTDSYIDSYSQMMSQSQISSTEIKTNFSKSSKPDSATSSNASSSASRRDALTKSPMKTPHGGKSSSNSTSSSGPIYSFFSKVTGLATSQGDGTNSNNQLGGSTNSNSNSSNTSSSSHNNSNKAAAQKKELHDSNRTDSSVKKKPKTAAEAPVKVVSTVKKTNATAVNTVNNSSTVDPKDRYKSIEFPEDKIVESDDEVEHIISVVEPIHGVTTLSSKNSSSSFIDLSGKTDSTNSSKLSSGLPNKRKQTAPQKYEAAKFRKILSMEAALKR